MILRIPQWACCVTFRCLAVCSTPLQTRVNSKASRRAYDCVLIELQMTLCTQPAQDQLDSSVRLCWLTVCTKPLKHTRKLKGQQAGV